MQGKTSSDHSFLIISSGEGEVAPRGMYTLSVTEENTGSSEREKAGGGGPHIIKQRPLSRFRLGKEKSIGTFPETGKGRQRSSM